MPGNVNDENPLWTEETFARAKSASEVLPEKVISAFKRGRGPQKAPRKAQVSLRLDPEVLAHFRSEGRGWQSRINQVLKAEVTAANEGSRSKAVNRS